MVQKNIIEWISRQNEGYAYQSRHSTPGDESDPAPVMRPPSISGLTLPDAPEEKLLFGEGEDDRQAIREGIAKAGLPEEGFVFQRTRDEAGNISFDVFIWPSYNQNQQLQDEIRDLLMAREMKLTATPSYRLDDGAPSTASVNVDVKNNPLINVTANAAAADAKVATATPEKKAIGVKKVQMARPGSTDPFQAFKEGLLVGKALGVAMVNEANARKQAGMKSVNSWRTRFTGKISPIRNVASTGGAEPFGGVQSVEVDFEPNKIVSEPGAARAYGRYFFLTAAIGIFGFLMLQGRAKKIKSVVLKNLKKWRRRENNSERTKVTEVA